MTEVEHVLTRAKQEIQTLRRQNELLGLQMSVVDVFAAALGLKRSEQGACIDVCWQIDKELDNLKAGADQQNL